MTGAGSPRTMLWPAMLITVGLLAGILAAVGPNPSASPASAAAAGRARAAGIAAGRAPAGRTAADAIRTIPEAFVSGPLRAPGGPFLVDSHGRVVILHGVNAVYKRAPYELVPAPGKPWNFGPADAARIAGLGFDVVRLGMTWAGLEPGTAGANDPAICRSGAPGDPHQWSAAVATGYLQRLARTVDLLGRYHIYTLLDMHQDIYSSAFGGEGAPLWAVCTGGVPFTRPPGRWSRAYASTAVDAAFQTFWTNRAVGNLQGQFDQAWTDVATYFRSNPWIVGYDPFNEPFSLSLGMQGDDRFGSELSCFYLGRTLASTATAGRAPLSCPAGDPAVGLLPRLLAADPTHLVFPEPDIFGRHDAPPSTLGPIDLPRVVFNVHVYCGQRNLAGNPTDLASCVAHQASTLTRRASERRELATAAQPGGPAWFMSEFGATSDVALLDRVTALADTNLVGWAYWQWKYYGDPTGSTDEALALPDGQLRPTAAALSQTYAQAIAGRPLAMSYDPSSGAFHLAYVPNPAVTAPTVVFVPVAMHYPAGYCTAASGATVLSRPGSTRLLLRNAPGAKLVQVNLSAGRCPGSSPAPGTTVRS